MIDEKKKVIHCTKTSSYIKTSYAAVVAADSATPIFTEERMQGELGASRC